MWQIKEKILSRYSLEQILVIVSSIVYLTALLIHYIYIHWIDTNYGITIADQRVFTIRAWGVLNFKLPYRDFWTNAAPLSPYLWGALMVPSEIGGADFSYVLRLFFTTTLILSGIILYRLLSKKNEKKAFIVSLIYTINPFFLWLVTFWGSDECILPLLFLLPIYLFERGNNTLATIVIIIGASLKYFPVIMAPAIWYYTKNWKERVKETVIFIGLLLVVTLPFYFIDPEKFLYQFEDPVGEGGNQGIFTVLEYTAGINLDNYGTILLLICIAILALISLSFFVKKAQWKYYHSLAIVMAFLVFYKKIQSSYFTMAYPFIAAGVVLGNKKNLIGITWAILSMGYGEAANYLINGGTNTLISTGSWCYVSIFYLTSIIVIVISVLDAVIPLQKAGKLSSKREKKK